MPETPLAGIACAAPTSAMQPQLRPIKGNTKFEILEIVINAFGDY